MVELCKWYPKTSEEGPVCGAGAEISSKYPCTAEDALECTWFDDAERWHENVEES